MKCYKKGSVILGNSMKFFRIYILAIMALATDLSRAVDVSFTMDDPNMKQTHLLSPYDRNEKILEAFDRYRIKATLFVSGDKINNLEGKAIVQAWDDRGHQIANHSFSHVNYEDVDFEVFKEDFVRNESIIQKFQNFTKLFRFPFLKEGETFTKRDAMRGYLKEKGYQQGYVTIDASDWYIDHRMAERLKADPKAYLESYRDFYLDHMWKRATYYNDLGKKLFGREIKHTILIHHNLLNALYLQDLMKMFERKGWNLISSEQAFQDPIFKLEPNILPAGESIVWSAAKESGRFKTLLRYPAEDGDYEKSEMDRLGL